MVRGSKLDYGVTPEGSTVSRTAFLFPLEDTRDPLLQESAGNPSCLKFQGIPRLVGLARDDRDGDRSASLRVTEAARRRHLTDFRMNPTF